MREARGHPGCLSTRRGAKGWFEICRVMALKRGDPLPAGPAGTFGHRRVGWSRGGWPMATSNGHMPMSGCDRWPSFDDDLWSRGGKTWLHLQFFRSGFLVYFWFPRGVLGPYLVVEYSLFPRRMILHFLSGDRAWPGQRMGFSVVCPGWLRLKRILVGVMRSCDDFTCTLPAHSVLQGPLPSWLSDAAGSDQAGERADERDRRSTGQSDPG